MGVVDKISTATASGVYRLIQSGGNWTHKLFPVTRDRAQLLFPEIAPLAGLLTAEMYREGYEASKGNAPTMGRLITNMVEGALSYAITSTVTTIYTIIGFLKGSYDAGKAQSAGEKTYAAIKNGVLFFTGFLGVNAGVQYAHLMRQMHSRELLKSFLGKDAYYKLFKAEKQMAFDKVPNMTGFLSKDLHAVPGISDELKTGLSELKDLMHGVVTQAKRLCLPMDYAKEFQISEKNPATIRKMKLLSGGFEAAQNAMTNKYTQLLAQHGDVKLQGALKSALGEGLKDFHQVMQQAGRYNNYELFRMMNPIFGYVLTIGMIGVPIVKLASMMLSSPGEEPIDKHFGMRDTSLYLETFPRFQTHTGNVFAGHGASHGGEAFPYYNGPGLIQWAADHKI